MNAKVKEFWQQFLERTPAVPRDLPFQVWHFGNNRQMATELANLVMTGRKCATASLAVVDQLKPEEAPVPDGYSVVTDLDGDPKCVIRTTEIRHLPFDDVDAEFAYDEGEGDQTLEYWRDVHRRYFTREAADLGLEFNERSIVSCERFELLYPR